MTPPQPIGPIIVRHEHSNAAETQDKFQIYFMKMRKALKEEANMESNDLGLKVGKH